LEQCHEFHFGQLWRTDHVKMVLLVDFGSWVRGRSCLKSMRMRTKSKDSVSPE
jgi:hypothetical protein